MDAAIDVKLALSKDHFPKQKLDSGQN